MPSRTMRSELYVLFSHTRRPAGMPRRGRRNFIFNYLLHAKDVVSSFMSNGCHSSPASPVRRHGLERLDEIKGCPVIPDYRLVRLDHELHVGAHRLSMLSP